MESAYYWLIAGAVLMVLEAFAVPGIGFMFAGLAALLTGLLVKLGFTGDNIYAQFATFFGLTVIWAALLWKTLKSFRLNPKGGHYDNMVGTSATVHEKPLVHGVPGQVKWSGALMNAELSSNASGEALQDTQVEIVAVKGNTLIVKPK